MNFTFKKQPKETGLCAVGYYSQSVDIKLGGKICGIISAPNWQTKDNCYEIRLMVYKTETETDSNPNCNWKWITFKFKSESEQECRNFLKENYKVIVEKYTLRFMD